MTDDQKLLRQYADDHSESAFGELVNRHIDLVYSAALRVANGDMHLARDITQTVFIDLARKPEKVPRDAVLAGWLHRHTCFTAATAIRAEQRRKAREQTAAEMSSLDDNTEPLWEAVAPQLDRALNQLNPSDRDAIVLRFLKRMDFRTLGATLGVSEDAAQKRVTRALEKLRGTLGLRGVHLSVIALTTLLAANAANAAPAGLAVGVSTVALTAAKTPGTLLALLKLMASTKTKFAVLGALMLAGAGTPLLIHQQAQAALYAQTTAIQQRADEIAQKESGNARLSNSLSRASSRAFPTNQSTEVLKLRGEIGRLQAAMREMSGSKTNAPLSRDEFLASMRQLYADRVARLKQVFHDDPTQSVPEMQYLTDHDWLELIEYDQHLIDPDNSNALSAVRGHAQSRFAIGPLAAALRQYAKSNSGQFPTDVSQLAPYFEPPVDDSVLQDWTVLATSRLPGSLQVNEPWVITQKAPVNADVDQRFVVGLHITRFGGRGADVWNIAP